MKVVPVIISGGAGSRLWPASRQSHPKPFLKVADGHSLMQHTVLRVGSIKGVVELVAVTSGEHLFLTKDEFDELGPIYIQDSQRGLALIHCVPKVLIRSATDGQTVRTDERPVGAHRCAVAG